MADQSKARTPKEMFEFLPLDEEVKKGYRYAMEGKLKEDTYFHVRFRIYFGELAAVNFIFLINHPRDSQSIILTILKTQYPFRQVQLHEVIPAHLS